MFKVPLVEKYQKVRFCSQYGVQSVKREFRLWLQKYLLSGLEEVARELVDDEGYEKFRNYLCIFLEVCSKILRETYVLSSTYTSLLKSDARKKDQNPRYETDHKTLKSLKDARESFYKHTEVQRSLKFDENDFVDMGNGNKISGADAKVHENICGFGSSRNERGAGESAR
ncbi:PREDICTED: uncharacterized protein LOC105360345 [Ceratosolen solmsi marchali]|uniref:Uncharacterized protein LOC105360345 n=1 Tax=Ceratosolen solmsi marchali TaxID=326594 RepID=A0AAJ6YCU8_9HYME|nr:PREDICTED: uncharacterized protein LOC105360345 [Ceratosolen solmsi marchali]